MALCLCYGLTNDALIHLCLVVSRVPRHGERRTLDCARTFHGYGHALLRKAPETDPSGNNVSSNAPNEESVKSTATYHQ